jgi:hypothetical protein
MTLQERILYHQVHPLKLLTDVTTAVLSLWLLAEGRLALALLVMFLPPVIVSVVVMRSVSLEDIKASALGRYVLRYMTPATTFFRAAGMLIMALAAWRHQWGAVAAGAGIVFCAWGRGLLYRA